MVEGRREASSSKMYTYWLAYPICDAYTWHMREGDRDRSRVREGDGENK